MRNSYPLTIGSLLKQTVDRRGTAEIVYGKTRYTWPKLLERVNGLAAGLSSMGVRTGSKVAVIDLDTNRYLEAAVIGAKDPKWGERPLAVVCLKPGATATEEELLAHLARFVEMGKITKFWIPDKIVVRDAPLPKTSTGKLDKKPLRESYSISAA